MREEAVSKGQPFFLRLRGKKKRKPKRSSFNARRYLAFVLTKTKVVFKNYPPDWPGCSNKNNLSPARMLCGGACGGHPCLIEFLTCDRTKN
jgi:hypothetical protein